MKMFGMGVPEMIVGLAIYALIIFVFYWIIKKAVKNGILEAHEKLAEEGKEPKGGPAQ